MRKECDFHHQGWKLCTISYQVVFPTFWPFILNYSFLGGTIIRALTMYISENEREQNKYGTVKIFHFVKSLTLRFWLRDFTLFSHKTLSKLQIRRQKFTLFMDYRHMVVVSFESKTF